MVNTDEFFDMNAAPMRIGTVRLKVRDIKSVSAFYQATLGLRPIEQSGSRIALGTGAKPLLELVGDRSLPPNDPQQAGLFHTAFLMPTRADLARWVAHAGANRVQIQGASDHIVSEALYLADPEGNGIEIYADRAPTHWRNQAGEIQMSTDPLDLKDLLQSAAGAAWSGFPERGTIGHVHLQVGDTQVADDFYRVVLGFDIAARYPGASFYGSGGYHHQLAGNIWNSRRAGARQKDMAGLDQVEIVVSDDKALEAIAARAERGGYPITNGADGLSLSDPWGTAIVLTA